jgi:hypothetical protein
MTSCGLLTTLHGIAINLTKPEPDADTMLLSIYKCEQYHQHALDLTCVQNHLRCSQKHVRALSPL